MRIGSTLRLVSLVLALAGCTAAVSDINGFVEDDEFCAPGGNINEVRDLRLDLVEMNAHVTNLFEATVVNDMSGVLTSRIIYDPLVDVNVTINVDNAMPRGTYTLDFYADLDNDRVYTSAPDDHSWHRTLCNDGSLTFVHIAMFEPLNRERRIGENFVLNISNIPLTARMGSIEARVIARFPGGLNQTVGVYRFTNVLERRVVPLGATATLRIDGIIDVGTEHTIYYFFDQNRDGIGDGGMGDLICMRDEVSDSSVDGGSIVLDLDMMQQQAMGLCGLNTVPGADDPIPPID